MAASARRKGRGSSGVPLWVLFGLVVLLVGAVVLRLKLVPRAPRPSAPRESPAAPAPSKRREAKERQAAPRPKPEAQEAAPAAPAPPKPAPSLTPGTTSVALVIDDVGYRLDLVQEAAVTLPPVVTFAVIPFLPESEASARYLHDHGFPVILHAPMEPEHPERWKATAGMLTVGMPRAEVDRILEADLKAVPFAEGINNHMGSLATTDRTMMEDVAEVLKARGLYFLDSRTTVRTVAFDVARSRGLPTAFRSVFLDDKDEENAIIAQFDLLVARAEKEGTLVAIGHLRPRTISVVAGRIPYWEKRGVKFLPLREVVR